MYSSINPTEDDILELTALYKFDTKIEIEYSYDYVYPEHKLGSGHNNYMGNQKYIRLKNTHIHAFGYKATLDNSKVATDKPNKSSNTSTWLSGDPLKHFKVESFQEISIDDREALLRTFITSPTDEELINKLKYDYQILDWIYKHLKDYPVDKLLYYIWLNFNRKDDT